MKHNDPSTVDTGFGIVPVPNVPDGQPEPVWELATMYPPQGAWSEEEYLSLTDGGNRLIEYVEGRLEFLAMPTRVHTRLMKQLLFLLSAFVDERGLGEVLPTGMRLRVLVDGDKNRYRIPDIVFLSEKNEKAWGGNRFFAGVDLAIEIVSEDDQSRRRDYIEKVADYSAGKVAEYWIVDPQDDKITVLTLPENASEYAEHGVFTPSDTATSVLLDGFTVDVKACFEAAKK